MRSLMWGLLLLLAAAPAFAQDAAPGPAAAPAPPVPDRIQEFWADSVLSPLFYLKAVGAGVIDQWDGLPQEWSGSSGLAKREESRFAQGFAAEVIGHAAAAALHHRVAYDPCTCTGAGPRLAHALSRAFVSRTYGGRLVPNVSLIVAQYGSAALANVWYPESYRTGDVVTSGSIAFGASMGFKVLSEFTPEVKRLLHVN